MSLNTLPSGPKAPVVVAHKARRAIEVHAPRHGAFSVAPIRLTSFVHGAGLAGERFVCEDADLASHPALARWPEGIRDLGLSLRGSLCLYLFDEVTGDGAILPDPLGGGLCFMYEDQDVRAVSSDLAHLVSWLKRQGKAPRKSALYAAMLLAYENGSFDHSSYSDIRILSANHYLRIRGGAFEELEYPVKALFLDRSGSYEDALEGAIEELKAGAAALAATTFRRRISHLTGGMDSRLVLACLLSAGAASDFQFFCSGRVGTADQDNARLVAGAFELTMTQNGGLRAVRIPVQMEDAFLWEMRSCDGLLPNASVHDGFGTARDTLILSGGYGECFRAFYTRELDLTRQHTIPELAHSLWNHTCFPLQGPGLFTEQTVSHLHALFEGYLNAKAQAGFALSDALELMYIENRNRYFLGLSAKLTSDYAPRMDPLYSLQAIRAGFRAGTAHKRVNKVGFDLMSALAPGLVTLPFGTTSWHPSLLAPEQVVAPSPASGLKLLHDATASTPRWMEQPKATPAQVARAKALAANMWHVAYFEAAQARCRKLLADGAGGELRGMLHEPTLNRLLTQQPNHRAYYRQVYAILNVLLWLSDAQ